MRAIGLLSILALACTRESVTAPGTQARSEGGSGSIMLRVISSYGAPVFIGGHPGLTVRIPQPLGGLMSLGIADADTSCLAIPTSFELHAVSVTNGAVDTVCWDASEPMYISAIDTASLVEVGYTTDFVPGTSRGWTITVPGDTVAPIAGAPCSPR